MEASLLTGVQEHLGQIFQTIGLLLDVTGVLLIVKFFRKTTYQDNSHFGIPTNTASLLTSLANEARFGSVFLVLGFLFQLIGVWL